MTNVYHIQILPAFDGIEFKKNPCVWAVQAKNIGEAIEKLQTQIFNPFPEHFRYNPLALKCEVEDLTGILL